MKIKVKKLPHFDDSLPLPNYATIGSVGADIYYSGHIIQYQQPGESIQYSTGLAFEIPEGYELQIRPKSGLASYGIVAHFGTIDSDYRGELMILIHNISDSYIRIAHGDKIAQIVLAPVLKAEFEVVDELSNTERGDGGFGSTGR